MRYRLLLLLALLVSAACSATEPDGEDTTTPAASPATTAAELDIEYGRNDDGTFYQGAAAAPVTLIDYSDFL